MSNLTNNTNELQEVINLLQDKIAGGSDTSDATATADEIFAGETAYNAEGKVTGTFTIENELTAQDGLITQIAAALQNKAAGGGGGTDTSDATAVAGDILKNKTAYVKDRKITGTIETKTSSDLSTNGATVTVPVGYYATQATKSVATTTQASPSISISSSGLITSSVTQSEGYIAEGTKSTTKQLTTKGATAITPKTSAQIAVSSGIYTTGTITVDPIPSEYIIPSGTLSIAANGSYNVKSHELVSVNVPIPSGYIKPSGSITITQNGAYNVTKKASAVVSIPEREIALQDITIDTNGIYTADDGYDGFGQVTVEVAGSTNTESEEVAGLLGNTMTVLDNSLVTTLRTRACQGATKLATVNLPMVTSLGSYAFYQCSGLISFHLPKLTSVSTQTWYSCTKLQHADCGQLGNIPAQTFNACSALTELILRKTSSICTLSNVNGVNNSPIGKGTGYVYVPSALIDAYKTATNWSTFANQFRAIEDYPEICG